MTELETFVSNLCTAPEDGAGVRERLASHLLDTLGALVAATATGEGRKLTAPIGPLSPLGDSHLDAIARAAALVRLTEVDDIHLRSCVTASAIVIPVALGFAGVAASSPSRCALAICGGYEAMIRLAQALDGPRILYRGLWPSYLVAPIGAAVAAGLVLGLDQDAMARALAIALTQISGAPGRPEGTSPRWLLAGLAARAGCVAALMAKQGYGGDLSLLDGDWLARTHGLTLDKAPLRAARAEAAVFELSQKPFCGAKQTIAATEAFLRLIGQGLVCGDIAKLRVFAPEAYVGMISQTPDSRSGRMASVAYQLALAAYRESDLLDIERADLNDDRISAFLGKVEVRADAALDALYPAVWPARVEVETRDGARRECSVAAAKGDVGRRLDASEVEQKFHRLAEPTAGLARSRALAQSALRAFEDASALAAVCAEFAHFSRSQR